MFSLSKGPGFWLNSTQITHTLDTSILPFWAFFKKSKQSHKLSILPHNKALCSVESSGDSGFSV
jgi:hypothetical protein